MTGSDWLLLATILALFLFSIALAVAETAFVRMSRIRARSLQEERPGRRSDRLVWLMEQEHPEQTLNVVLLLVLVSQLTSAFLLGVLADRLFGVWGAATGIVIQIVAYFVIAEAAPKTWVIQNTDAAALRVAPLLYGLTRFPPLRVTSRGLIGLANVLLPGKGLKQGPFVTEAEIKSMVDLAADEASIETEEREFIHSLFEFGDTVVHEVMTPRTDMTAVDVSTSIADALEIAIGAGYSRLPAFDKTRDDIKGLLILKDLVALWAKGEVSDTIQAHLREAHFVPEHKPAAELLKEMQADKFHMAVVVDEYGGTAGVVTLEDLIEELVGEIVDEFDVEEPEIELLADGQLRVPGNTSIDDLSGELEMDLPPSEWETVGGLLFNTLGHVPEVGETVEYGQLALCAETLQGQRILSVLVSVRPDAAVDDESGSSERGIMTGMVSTDHRSGFVSVVGRPNVGKSTLVNRLVGSKVSIVSDKPQTTRNAIRGVLTEPDHQVVFLDTPGLHRPRTLLGERVNETARSAFGGVDVVCMVIEADGRIGPGDRFIAGLLSEVSVPVILVVNKSDAASPAALAEQLARAQAELGDPDAFVPVSARTGDGCDALLDEIVSRLQTGPRYYPPDVVTDQPESFLAAEFLREQLIATAREELPHSIAVVVDEFDEREGENPLISIRARVLVERESQKGIVIGKGGAGIKRAGTRAREELERVLGVKVYLETKVKVERDWQRRAHALDRLDL